MKTRDFNNAIRAISANNLVDISKIKKLDNGTRTSVVEYIVRYRYPILKELIPEGFDTSWLHAMGYLYETKGKRFTFVHTAEHKIK